MTKKVEDSIPFPGGKFRKKPSSRPRTMPYHRRRSRTLQIRRNYNDNGRDGGWLSRIVDPTSKLIAGGVQKLFSSVFRRRLPLPAPPPQSPPDGNVQQNDRGDARFVNSVVVLSDGTILSSENVNHPANVNDHNVVLALPAKIPKAIKSSNSGKGSSSALGLLNQTVAEEHPVFSTFELHRPTCYTTPQKQFSTARTSQNDFVIPRPHGRSARYNRDRATKDSGTRNDAYVGESLSSQKELTASGMNHEKEEVQGEMFRKGSLVEISSDEDGYKGAWFPATVVEVLEKGKYLIEHLELRTDDDTELMKEEVDALHIRPTPPKTKKTGRYDLYEKVDALQNDVWWVGVIVRVLAHSRYLVYFKESSEKLKFTHDELRPHQDWIDGKWITAS